MGQESESIRIVVASECPETRRDLRRMLQAEGIRVAGEVANTNGALKLARQLRPDAWLLELDMLRRAEPQPSNDLSDILFGGRSVVMISAVERVQVVDAFRLGAQAIVAKSTPANLLARSIRDVVAGHYWLDSKILAILVQTLRELLVHANGSASADQYGLTPRELDIIGEIVSGRSNREVSREFAISERTVKHHLTNIFNKLGVSSRLALALFAVNHQLTGTRGAAAEAPARWTCRGN